MNTTNDPKNKTSQDILNDYVTRYEQSLLSQRTLEKELQVLSSTASTSTSTSTSTNNKSTSSHPNSTKTTAQDPWQAIASIVLQNATMNGIMMSAMETCKRNVNVDQDSMEGLYCLWNQCNYQREHAPSTLRKPSNQSKPLKPSNQQELLNHFASLAMQQRNHLVSSTESVCNNDPRMVFSNKDTSLENFFQSFPECQGNDEQDSILELELLPNIHYHHNHNHTTTTNNNNNNNNSWNTTQSNVEKHPHVTMTTVDGTSTRNDQIPSSTITNKSFLPSTSSLSSSWDQYNNTNHHAHDPMNGFCAASEIKTNNAHSSNHNHHDTIYDHDTTTTTATTTTTHPPSSNVQSSTSQYNPHRPNLTAGLKKKFQLPKKPRLQDQHSNHHYNNNNNNNHTNTTHHSKRQPTTTNGTNHQEKDDDQELPEELQHLDAELVRKIENEICDSGDPITFQDIAGLMDAKQTVMELVCWPMKRPDLFTGLRRGPNGMLLFGPPGTGKTLIGKAIAHESGATFFSISSSSLTSKWIGEGEKLVRTLFAVAAYREPAVVFIDEIDSLLTQRKSDENEASRRIKTEFLVQLDGTGTSGQGRVLVIGATNRPQELDDAARRRFVKRLYIPLPEAADREILLRTLLSKNHHNLTEKDVQKLSIETAGFSGADLKALCTDAALGPIRQLGHRALEIAACDVPPISYKHFRHALKGMNPSVAQSDLDCYLDFNKTYGSKSVTAEDYDGLSEDEE